MVSHYPVLGQEHKLIFNIGVSTTDTRDDYIPLTGIARYKGDEPKIVIRNWMRNRNTIEYLGVWETLHNPDCKGLEFDAFGLESE